MVNEAAVTVQRLFNALLLSSAIFCAGGLVGFPPVPTAAAEAGRLGPWNSFLGQTNVVECANPTDSLVIANMAIRSEANQTILEFPFGIGPHGTQHLDLTPTVPGNAYGTYFVSSIYPDPGSLDVRCATMAYRFSSPGATRIIDYAYSLPTFSELRGTSAGIFNSFRPDGREGVVYNWLSVVNLSNGILRGFVEVFRPDGSFNVERSFALPDLLPGQRHDFPLGHPDGQQAGIYRVVINDVNQPYSAFVTRFSPEDGGRFSFAFPSLARQPTCDSMVLPASTMDPAYNWAEIANPTPSARDVLLSIYDSLGIPRFEHRFVLSAFSQYHVFLNQYIGEHNVGAFQVRCASGGGSGSGLIAQSAFYGRRNGQVDWAYVSQGSPEAPEGTRFVHLYNTHLGAANWNKLIARDVRGGFGDTQSYSMEGILQRLKSSPLLPNGAVDLALHEDAGYDRYGMSIANGSVGGASLSSDLLRVFNDSRGGIGYIMNVPPLGVPPKGPQDGRSRVVPGARHFEVGGRSQMIVGESLTQAWMELGTDFKQIELLDALKARGINQFLIWSYIGIDDQTADPRIGYHAPRLWPWIEASNRTTPPYDFRYNTPDGDPIFNPAYFRRLRELAEAANNRGVTLIITIHDGWTKQRFLGHPMNVANGGYLTAKEQYVDLANPNAEMAKKWDWNWSAKERHQWILERFTEELVRSVSDVPNVFFEILNEGEWYNVNQADAFQRHFIDFISARSSRPILVNQHENPLTNFQQHAQVDVITHHFPPWGSNSTAKTSFSYYSAEWNDPTTTKPVIFDEPVPGYDGSVANRTALTRLMWGTLLGRAGFTVQDDVSFRFDPNQVDPMIDRLGYASRFFNGPGAPDFTSMTPDGLLSSTEVCLARRGSEYIVYAQSGSSFGLDLSGETGSYEVRFYSPFTGQFSNVTQTINGGSNQIVQKPTGDDWVAWAKRQ